MRFLIVTQYYPPENTYISPSIAQALTAKGHRVRVLTGYPNYPTGKLFDGYRQRWRQRETIDGVDVLRVPLFADHSASPAKRALNYASFALTSATARSFAREADVIYVYATQLTPAFGPWLWNLLGGAPYVLHIQDLWPDSITGSSLLADGLRSRAIETLLTPWIGSLYRRAAAVIGIAPTMVDTLVARGVERSKAHLVYNWAMEYNSGPLQAESVRAEGATRILYAGNVGDMQDLETAVIAAHRAVDAGIRLDIVGDGVALPRVRRLAESLNASNIRFIGRVPREETQKYYREADFALVTLKDLPAFRGTIPSKFQASTSWGLPVITTVQGDVRALVESQDVGLTADAEDASSIESAFRRAAAAPADAIALMSARAASMYATHFAREPSVAAIAAILQEVAASRASDA